MGSPYSQRQDTLAQKKHNGVRPHGKEVLSRYALAPWGMQPNTSLWRMSATTCAVFGPCLCVYYIIFGNFCVTPCGRRSGKKSIFRAFASFAAVLR